LSFFKTLLKIKKVVLYNIMERKKPLPSPHESLVADQNLAILKALSTRSRALIFTFLLEARDGLTGKQIEAKLLERREPIHQTKVSEHLRSLKEVGLVADRRSGMSKIFTARRETLKHITDVLGALLSKDS
jgi:DNA-binding transcriptional ArsR family regulator